MSEREHMKGKKLKQYNFLFKLGGGVYGTVYKALDTKTENIVAIKVINKQQMKEVPKLEKLVASEIAILKDVNNQNVVRFLDTFSSKESIFIVTEFCNGGDMETYCKQKGKLQEDEALNFLRQILNGFRGLHDANCMHRDFKLANILLHNKICKIADLGFAKQIRQKSITTTQLGTSETMAPEVHQGKQYGWEADIWSIGVVFYEMLYGRPPYRGGNDYQILKNIKTTRPNFSQGNTSEQAIDFIQKCLEINPKNRLTWKQIYEHPLISRSDITLTTACRKSRLNVQKNKQYYTNHEKSKRKTIRLNADQIKEDEIRETEYQMFKDNGQIQNANKSADINADKIMKKRQQMDSQFIQYEVDIIQQRNNKMFGITQILPLEKTLKDIDINHSRPLYQICKHSFIQLKNFRNQIQSKSHIFKSYRLWKEFKQIQVYKNLVQQLKEDQSFAQSLAISYKYDIENTPQLINENINRETDKMTYKSSVQIYKKQLIFHMKEQSKRNKLRYIKMIKALQHLSSNSNYDMQSFNRETDNINVEEEEKKLLYYIQ